MSFDTDGFFSPTLEQFRASVRDVPSYRIWFKFAEGLNRLGLDILQDHEVPRHDIQRLTIAALFVRAHQSFQGALLLAERGMLGDARVILRSAVEGAIALNALANDASFMEQLTTAHRFNQRKIARLTLNTPDYRSLYSATEIAQMRATVSEVDAEEAAAGKKFCDIKWGVVAVKHCKDLYELVYRQLSDDGTHTNINAIHRHMEFDPSGQLIGLKIGPTTDDMIGVLKIACLTLIWAADPFARVTNQNPMRANIQDVIQRFATLPMEEPTGVTVTAKFRS
jgi:hypothetical protein